MLNKAIRFSGNIYKNETARFYFLLIITIIVVILLTVSLLPSIEYQETRNRFLQHKIAQSDKQIKEIRNLERVKAALITRALAEIVQIGRLLAQAL